MLSFLGVTRREAFGLVLAEDEAPADRWKWPFPGKGL